MFIRVVICNGSVNNTVNGNIMFANIALGVAGNTNTCMMDLHDMDESERERGAQVYYRQ